jgi:hypothetical protein
VDAALMDLDRDRCAELAGSGGEALDRAVDRRIVAARLRDEQGRDRRASPLEIGERGEVVGQPRLELEAGAVEVERAVEDGVAADVRLRLAHRPACDRTNAIAAATS